MKLLTGITQLIESPSGIFALLCLATLSVVTWHLGALAGMVAAWVAFFGMVPTALGYFEHKETLAALTQPVQQSVTTVVSSNLPPNGQL